LCDRKGKAATWETIEDGERHTRGEPLRSDGYGRGEEEGRPRETGARSEEEGGGRSTGSVGVVESAEFD